MNDYPNRVVPPSADRRNYRLYCHGGEVFAIRTNGDTPPQLFVQAGETRNVRALASADAVVYDGMLLDVVTETGWVVLQDPWAGIQDRLDPRRWRDPPFDTFDKIEVSDPGQDDPILTAKATEEER